MGIRKTSDTQSGPGPTLCASMLELELEVEVEVELDLEDLDDLVERVEPAGGAGVVGCHSLLSLHVDPTSGSGPARSTIANNDHRANRGNSLGHCDP